MGDIETLQSQVQQAQHIDQALLQKVVQLVQAQPKNSRAHYLLAQVYDRLGFDQLAQTEFKKSDDLQPMQAGQLLDLFTARLAVDDLNGAANYFSYLERRFPADPAVIFMRGTFLAGTKKDLANGMFDAAIRRSPAGNGIRTAVAAFQLHWENPEKALKLAKEDLAAKPNDFRTVLMVGKSLVGLHRYQEAIPYLTRAYQTKPTDTNLAQVYGAALTDAGLNQQALEPALVGLALQTDYDQLQKQKRAVLNLMNQVPLSDFQAAVASADQKLDNTPFQARLHLAMGDVYDKAHKLDLAIQQYRKGVELNPEESRGYYRLAVDLDRTGDYENALKNYDKAHQCNQGDMQISTGYARLYLRMLNRQNDLALRARDFLRSK